MRASWRHGVETQDHAGASANEPWWRRVVRLRNGPQRAILSQLGVWRRILRVSASTLSLLRLVLLELAMHLRRGKARIVPFARLQLTGTCTFPFAR
jgi:hypothetical protein